MASAEDVVPTWIDDMPTEKLIEIRDQYRSGVLHVGIERDGKLEEMPPESGEAIMLYIETVIRNRLN